MSNLREASPHCKHAKRDSRTPSTVATRTRMKKRMSAAAGKLRSTFWTAHVYRQARVRIRDTFNQKCLSIYSNGSREPTQTTVNLGKRPMKFTQN
jgi:hypothetical protein